MKDYGINLVNLKWGHAPSKIIYKRTCPICGKDFETNHHSKKYCSKECAKVATAEINKQWRKDNYERHLKLARKNQRKYYRNHKEKCCEYSRKYYSEHKEECKDYKKNYYHNHRDEVLEYNRNYYLNKKINACSTEHNHCFDCPTGDGECLFE